MLKRRTILKIAATSPLFLYSFNLFGKSSSLKANQQINPNGLLDEAGNVIKEPLLEKRIAVFSFPHTASHSLAHLYLQQLQQQGESSALFFNDELGMSNFQDEKSKVNFQRNQFKKEIANLGEDGSGVFSFRNLQSENVDFVLSNLKRLNFKIVFVEAKDLKKSALDWSLAINCNVNSTARWNSKQVKMEKNSVVLQEKYVQYFIEKHARALNVQKKLMSMNPEIMNQDHVEQLISKLSSKQKKYLWRDNRIHNSASVVQNLSEVKGWLRRWSLS